MVISWMRAASRDSISHRSEETSRGRCRMQCPRAVFLRSIWTWRRCPGMSNMWYCFVKAHTASDVTSTWRDPVSHLLLCTKNVVACKGGIFTHLFIIIFSHLSKASDLVYFPLRGLLKIRVMESAFKKNKCRWSLLVSFLITRYF